MIIQDYSLAYKSAHTQTSVRTKEESINAWASDASKIKDMKSALSGVRSALKSFNPEPATTGKSANDTSESNSNVRVNLSPASKNQPSRIGQNDFAKTKEELSMLLLAKLLEKLTGAKIDVSDLKDVMSGKGKNNMQDFLAECRCPQNSQAGSSQGSNGQVQQQQPVNFQGGASQGQDGQAQQPQAVGWGIEASSVETYSEEESMRFSAAGLIKTADGKEIAVSIDMSMSRSFYSESSMSLRMGDALLKDPLVVNYAGSSADLTDAKYSFDLNSDGTKEQMSFVSQGSGFLALDKNGNGAIDDGTELFGAQSGNGFKDLASYDKDGNHWIDEKDEVFNQLKVWSKDSAGNDSLMSLKQAGVGAINLDAAATQFSIKDAANNTQGAVRSTSIFLGENGGAGTVQQIDLALA